MVAHGGAGLFVDHKKGEIPELKALLRDSAVSKVRLHPTSLTTVTIAIQFDTHPPPQSSPLGDSFPRLLRRQYSAMVVFLSIVMLPTSHEMKCKSGCQSPTRLCRHQRLFFVADVGGFTALLSLSCCCCGCTYSNTILHRGGETHRFLTNTRMCTCRIQSRNAWSWRELLAT